MAENVETLLVELDSTTAKLRQELNKAERTVSGTENKINRSTRAIDRAFDRVSRSARAMGQRINGAVKAAFSLRGAMIGIGAATGAALAIERTVDSVNRLGKAAKTADLTAESVQELTFAFGQLADVNDNQVNMSLQRFSRRLGLAVDGTGAAKDTFGELGVQLVDTNGKVRETQTVLDETLEALANIESDSFRAAKASEVFGEDAGPRLAAALQGGIKGMEDAKQQARDLGLVLSNDMVAGAEEMADEFRILQQRVLKNFQRIILENKESILALVEAIGSAITKIGEFAKALQALDDRKEIEERTEKMEELTEQLFTLINHRKRLNDELREDFPRDEIIHGLGMSLEDLDDKIASTRAQLESLINIATGGNKPPVIGIDTGGGGGGGGGGTPTPRTPSDPSRFFAGPAEAGNLTIEQQEILYKRAQKAEEEANKSAQEGARKTADSLSEVTDEQREMERLNQQLGFTFSSAFEDAIIEGKKLREVLAGIAKDIQRIFIRKTATEPAANALANVITSAFAGGASTSGGTAVGDMVPVNTSTGSAMGNVFESPSLTRISERGQPEGVFPLERRNGKLGIRADGVGGNTIYVDARGADQAAVARIEAVLGDIDKNFEARANAAVIDDASRGGALRGAIS